MILTSYLLLWVLTGSLPQTAAELPQATVPQAVTAERQPLAVVLLTPSPTSNDVIRVGPVPDAAAVAFSLRQRPKGSRVIEVGDLAHDLIGNPLDGCIRRDGRRDTFPSPWLDEGTKVVAERVRQFFKAMAATGVVPDLILVEPRRTLRVGSFASPGDPTWGAIAADPRFSGWASRLGIKSVQDLAEGSANRLRWDYAIGAVFDSAMGEAIAAPAREVFADSPVSVRGSYGITPAFASIDHLPAPDVRTSSPSLPRSSPEVDGWMDVGATSWASGSLGPVGAGPFAALRKQVHRQRSIQSSDARPATPWICIQAITDGQPDPLKGSQYLGELARLLVLDGARALVVDCADSDRKEIDSAVAEMASSAGTELRAIPLPRPDWDARTVAAGATTADGEIWRIVCSPGVRRIRVLVNAIPRSIDIPFGETGAWLRLGRDQMLARDERGQPIIEVYQLEDAIPLVSTRATNFHSAGFGEFLRTLGASVDVSEMYPQSPPNSPAEGDPSTWGDVARIKAGESNPAGPEAGKVAFSGWNLLEFPGKPFGWGPSAITGATSGSLPGWVDESPSLRILHDPTSWAGFLDVDYEGWCAQWRSASPGGRTPGDERMIQAFDAALQTIRNKFPRVHIGFYGLPEYWYPGNPASAGVMRAMMGIEKNPVLAGSPNVPAPRGTQGARDFLTVLANLQTASRDLQDPKFLDFVASRCDALTPTCYMKSQVDGRPGWNKVELIAATTDEERAYAMAAGAITAPPGPDLAAWNSRVFTGKFAKIGDRDTPTYRDERLPQLGWHTSNYWHTYWQVEAARKLQADVLARSGRRLPVLATVGWMNPTILVSEQTKLHPFTVDEFREGALQAAKDAGADGLYIWDWYLPLALEWVTIYRDKDQHGALDITGLRDMLRKQLEIAGLDKTTNGLPFLPASNSVADDARWTQLDFLLGLSQRIEESSKPYYRAAVELFPVQPRPVPAADSPEHGEHR